MSNHETNWIVKLVDQVTAPAKAATSVSKKLSDTVKQITQNLDQMGAEAKESAQQALTSHRELTSLIQKEEKQVHKLRLELREAGDALDPLRKGKIEFDIEEALTRSRRYQEQLVEVGAELENIEAGPDPSKIKKSWGEAIVVANQTMELIQGAIEGLEFTKTIDDLKSNIQMMSETSGAELDRLTAKAYKLGKVYNEAPEEIAKAANAMTKQLGGTYDQNFALIEAGFQRGANLNGDFLQQLAEYGPQLKEAGLSASESIAIMAKAGKDGVFDDKAIDAIKEGNLALREMGQGQIDALAGLGLKAKDLAGKTTFEAMQMISKQMEGASDQARQLALTDIFKGAGEDAGKGFIEGLATMDLDINKIPAFEQSGAGINGWLADLQTSFASTFSAIGSSVMYLAPVITAIGTMIPLITTFTASNWSLNAALAANPIGVIVVAIVALIAIIASAIYYYDEWGAAVLAMIGPLGWIVIMIMSFRKHWDSIVEAFKSEGIIGGIKRIGLTILDALLLPIQELLELLAKIPGMGGVAAGIGGWVHKFRSDMKLTTAEEEASRKKKPEEEKLADFDFKNMGKDAFKLDGKTAITGKEKTASASGNSSRIINMTLNVDNNVNVKDGGDFMARKNEILDYIVGRINDSMKDSLIAAGS